jgi:hypothetical protein
MHRLVHHSTLCILFTDRIIAFVQQNRLGKKTYLNQLPFEIKHPRDFQLLCSVFYAGAEKKLDERYREFDLVIDELGERNVEIEYEVPVENRRIG